LGLPDRRNRRTVQRGLNVLAAGFGRGSSPRQAWRDASEQALDGTAPKQVNGGIRYPRQA
jgi:hypothetical protein